MRAALERLWSGAVPRGRETTRLELERHRRAVLRNGRRIDLTAREFSVLEQLLQRDGETCSAHELVVAVWGTDDPNGIDVVDVYVQRLRAKLGDDAIETVPGTGYRIRPSAFTRLM